MRYVRLANSHKKLLRRATKALAKRRGHPVTEGQTVAEGARLVVLFNGVWLNHDPPPLKPGEVDPFLDPRIVFEGLCPTASQDVDEILYGLKRERPHRGKARSRPAERRARSKGKKKAADEN
jgi:hypothetical protein